MNGVNMGCGGCGSKPSRTLRKQQVQKSRESGKKVVQQRVRRKSNTAQADTSTPLRRQALVRDARCPHCSHTVMLVNIAGRERKQCTNCKFILK